MELPSIRVMNYEEIKEMADRQHTKFWDMHQYLNETGKEMLETYSIIDWNCAFAGNKTELAEIIQEDIERGKVKNKHVLRNLNNFIKLLSN